ncbi:MAG: hypothetical protein R3A52_06015 [Polyangiales bacterium]
MRRAHLVVALALCAAPTAVWGQPRDANAIAREVAARHLDEADRALRASRPLDAEEHFRRALEADPGLLPAALGWATALDHRGHRDEAVQVLRSLPPRAVTEPDDAVALATGYRSLRRPDLALDLLHGREAEPEALRAIVEVASEAGRFPEALAAARRLFSSGVGDPRRARTLVRALERLVAEADAVTSPVAPSSLRRALRER